MSNVLVQVQVPKHIRRSLTQTFLVLILTSEIPVKVEFSTASANRDIPGQDSSLIDDSIIVESLLSTLLSFSVKNISNRCFLFIHCESNPSRFVFKGESFSPALARAINTFRSEFVSIALFAYFLNETRKSSSFFSEPLFSCFRQLVFLDSNHLVAP